MMNAETFPVYRHSGKFGPHGPVLALLAAVFAGFPLGIAYSYLIKWIPFIYVNFLATAGYGFVFGLITALLMRFGKVRNTAVALLSGLGAGVIALYFEWSGHIHATFKGAPLLCSPADIASGMSYLYAHGSWALRHGSTVDGIPLAIIWGLEALFILVLAAFVPFSMVADTPFCEDKQCWLDEEKKISTLEPFSDPAMLAAFRAGDLGPLTQAKPVRPDALAFMRFTLKRSPKCDTFCTVRLQNVTVTISKDGKREEKVADLTKDLMLPASMFELIARFENFGATAQPPAAAAGSTEVPRLDAA